MGWFSEFSTQELEKSSEDQIILFKRPLLVSFIHLTFFRFHCFHRQLHPYISHLMCLWQALLRILKKTCKSLRARVLQRKTVICYLLKASFYVLFRWISTSEKLQSDGNDINSKETVAWKMEIYNFNWNDTTSRKTCDNWRDIFRIHFLLLLLLLQNMQTNSQFPKLKSVTQITKNIISFIDRPTLPSWCRLK